MNIVTNQSDNVGRVRICTRLVMDTTDPDIVFDDAGVCSYWHEFQDFKASLPSPKERDRILNATLERIRAAGRGRQYDCVLGLSGGVDSSYLALFAKEHGLRPLVVHIDNGWNSELAVSNIETMVERLGYHLETHVLEWDQFRDLQRAYFKASVIDLEVPTDNLIAGTLNRLASKHGVRFILSGNNYATEWLMPAAWNYSKEDGVNLRRIHRRFGERSIARLPVSDVWSSGYYHFVRGVRTVKLLNLIDYSKSHAKRRLIDELGWRDYGGKHYESTFTRFYQGSILPRKFNVDKRKAHLSTLILNGEISREAARRELQKPTYPEEEQQRDKEYVAKKLRFTLEQFEAVLSTANVPHQDYGTDHRHRALYWAVVSRMSAAKRRIFGRRAAVQT